MTTTWHGCYDENWNTLIVPEAFSHPAKMANGLVNRIFDYAIERGWIVPGESVVVDPFGGIGSTGIVGASKGVKVLCCELEAKFVQLARGGRCPGNYWPVGMGIVCSDCAGKRGKERMESHHITGNFELHRRTWEACGDPLPVIVQGDSRRLCEVLGQQLAACVVSSPPYAECLNAGGDTVHSEEKIRQLRQSGIAVGGGELRNSGRYGATPGQLGAMRAGDVAAVIGSPPFVDPRAQSGRSEQPELRSNRQGFAPGITNEYGDSAGQLSAMPTGSVEAIVSSPPYADQAVNGARANREANLEAAGIDSAAWMGKRRCTQGRSEGYGTTDGNIAAMPPGDVADAIASSPPYEGMLAKDRSENVRLDSMPDSVRAKLSKADLHERQYGNSDGQLGSEQGETFWSAAKEIVLQCHHILRPGGICVWVCKDFIRKGARVPFSADWQRLCIACGFEPVEWIKASLVKEQRHPGLFGEDVVTKTERKGFFRRLAEKKGSPPIDEEDVIIVRKPV